MPGEAEVLPTEARPRWPVSVAIPRITRFVPSRRAFVIAACAAATVAGGYAIARETSIFAIHRVDVSGGSKAVDAQVVRALAPFVGRNLVGLDGASVLQRVDALSTVVSATYDRSFPNTLHVTVVRERPVAVLRDGPAAWIVSERGRIIRSVATQGAPTLPRIWLADKSVRVGDVLSPRLGGNLARVLTQAGSLRTRIATAALASGVLVFHLRSGLEIVLGSPVDVALKVAVAEKVMQHLPAGTRIVDVSIPGRTVTSTYSS